MGGRHKRKGEAGWVPDPRRVPKKGEAGYKLQVRKKKPTKGEAGYKPDLRRRPPGAQIGTTSGRTLKLHENAARAYHAQQAAAGMSSRTRSARQQQSDNDIVQNHGTAGKNAELILDSVRTVECVQDGTGELQTNSASGAAQSDGVWTQKDADKCLAFVCKHHPEDVIASGWKIAVFRISKNEQLSKGRLWTFNDKPQKYPCNMNFYMSSSNIAVDRGMMTVFDVRDMFNEAGTGLISDFKLRCPTHG
jgi:hypothetical protein